MSLTDAPASLLATRGTTRALDANVTVACFDRAGSTAAFALGDGSLHLAPASSNDDWRTLALHDGAILALTTDAAPTGFLSAGDDGRLFRVATSAEPHLVFATGGKWIEHVASFAEPRAGLIACAAGRQVLLFDRHGQHLKALPHPSTVTGIGFDARGKRIAAAHYNGASLWFTASKSETPRLLEWKGSHIGIAVHPAAEAVVTAMQENALHGWRLPDGQHMRMTGYPAKTESLGFTHNGRYLASSGADAIVLWPFFGGGPMGKPPLELAQIEGILCTRIACHPKDDLVAAGFANGALVLAQISTSRVVVLSDAGPSPVSALAWSPDGARLAFGTESGLAGLLDLSAR